MSEQSIESKLFRGFLEVILNSNFDSGESRLAAKAIRSGKISESLAQVLDNFVAIGELSKSARDIAIPSPSGVRESSNQKNRGGLYSPDRLFDIVKRRKITKSALHDLFSRVNFALAPSVNEDLSMRDALKAFRTICSDNDWKLLSDIIDANLEIDPFLRGILAR